MKESCQFHRKEVYLNEYNVLQDNTAFLPYTTGLLQAYSMTRPLIVRNYKFMPIICARNSVENILSHYYKPAVAAFSVSMWNEQLCILVAKQLKVSFPNCLIVFGGWSIPLDPVIYCDNNQFVDVVIRGEGERSFAEILERYLVSKDFNGIGGVSYRHPETGLYIKNLNEQIPVDDKELNVFPSPYIEGIFDDLIKRSSFQFQAILETNRGCPYKCSFCSWGNGKSFKGVNFFNLERIERELEWIGKNKINYLFCADGNFGMFKRDLEIAKIIVAAKKEHGFPYKFRACYAKITNDNIIKIAILLNKYELAKSITISFQSFNKQALENVRRKNIDVKQFRKFQKIFKIKGIDIYSEFILGLPGETYESWISNMETCLRNSINNDVFVYTLGVYTNTELDTSSYKKKHGIRTARIPLNGSHSTIRPVDIPVEYEDVVIGTNSMSVGEWVKAIVISWVMRALIGLKLSYFIILYLVDKYKMKYMDLIECICKIKVNNKSSSIISKSVSQLYDLAESCTNGNSLTVICKDYGDIYWVPEEAFYLEMVSKKDEFYDSLYDSVLNLLSVSDFPIHYEEVKEIFKYQKIRTPQYFPLELGEIYFKYNIHEYFKNYFSDERKEIKEKQQVLVLDNPKDYNNDKRAFARDVILFGRRSPHMLLYSLKSVVNCNVHNVG